MLNLLRDVITIFRQGQMVKAIDSLETVEGGSDRVRSDDSIGSHLFHDARLLLRRGSFPSPCYEP